MREGGGGTEGWMTNFHHPRMDDEEEKRRKWKDWMSDQPTFCCTDHDQRSSEHRLLQIWMN